LAEHSCRVRSSKTIGQTRLSSSVVHASEWKPGEVHSHLQYYPGQLALKIILQ